MDRLAIVFQPSFHGLKWCEAPSVREIRATVTSICAGKQPAEAILHHRREAAEQHGGDRQAGHAGREHWQERRNADRCAALSGRAPSITPVPNGWPFLAKRLA